MTDLSHPRVPARLVLASLGAEPGLLVVDLDLTEVEATRRAVPVLAGRQAGGRTEILRGLDEGERIAAANAFLLKAELAKGEAGDDD